MADSFGSLQIFSCTLLPVSIRDLRLIGCTADLGPTGSADPSGARECSPILKRTRSCRVTTTQRVPFYFLGHHCHQKQLSCSHTGTEYATDAQTRNNITFGVALRSMRLPILRTQMERSRCFRPRQLTQWMLRVQEPLLDFQLSCQRLP